MDLAVRAFPALFVGAVNTVLYCIASFPLALLLGLLLAVMASSRITWFRVPARTFIEIIRGTPMIAQIFIIYYGIGALLGIYGLASLINAWTAGIASLAINYAAYEAEVFRAGLLSVDKGQTEAAYSLGLTGSQAFFRVVLPQAIPFMIPPFVNDFIYMLKDSAIVSVISGTELTSVLTFWITRNTSNSFPLYLIAIVFYLLMSLPTSYIARLFERRLRAAF